MRFFIVQGLVTAVATLALLYQAATSVYPDIGYILGLAVLLLTLLTGFAKLVRQNTLLQATVDEQGKAIARLEKTDEGICADIKDIRRKMHDMELRLPQINR